MLKSVFEKAALRLYDFCEYPAVRYKIMSHLLDKPSNDDRITLLRPEFLSSDIVEELYHEQDVYGGWGRFQSKDYSQKDKFPTSIVAINRCLYIGLTMDDRNIIFNAYEYLKDFIKGTAREKFRNSNERIAPWNNATFCKMIETIKPYNELCDSTFNKWLFIAHRTFDSGEYSYERERDAQHEVFGTREKRLVYMQTELLLKRRNQLHPELEECMLRHYGKQGYNNGYFWHYPLSSLPENFVYKKTRRRMYTLNYINQFKGSSLFLDDSVNWLLENQNDDGLWDWGAQTKDPWGYFCNFSTTRNYRHNKVVDCSMEILDFLKKYIDNNAE